METWEENEKDFANLRTSLMYIQYVLSLRVLFLEKKITLFLMLHSKIIHFLMIFI